MEDASFAGPRNNEHTISKGTVHTKEQEIKSNLWYLVGFRTHSNGWNICDNLNKEQKQGDYTLKKCGDCGMIIQEGFNSSCTFKHNDLSLKSDNPKDKTK